MKEEFSIQWLEEVDSTNSEALRNIGNLDNLSVIAASRQVAGRGQKGNSWLSRGGENLTFSIVMKFGKDQVKPLEARNQFDLSKASTLGITDYLESEGIGCRIKWPNDVYVGKHKICGMLIENSLDGKMLASSVIGIGLNVNQTEFPHVLVNPVSMKIVTGRDYLLDKELEKLCSAVVKRLKSIWSGLPSMNAEYESRLFRFGVFDSYVDCSDGNMFSGKIVGVTDSGLLEIETKEGGLKEFAFKEINYII